MAKLYEITDDTLDAQALKSDIPVLVDFWAEWCGPCKMVTPFLEEMAQEYKGKLRVVGLLLIG